MVNNFIAGISHFFAENKSLSYLLLVTISIFGVVSFLVLPKQYNPEIVRPAFVVSFAYEGANPEKTLDRVGYELIQKLRVVKGVEDIYTKISDGSTVISTVMFEVDYDKTQAKADLMTQLQSHSYLVSGAVRNLQVTEINSETIPVMQIVFSSDKATPSKVREQVLRLRESLLTVPDVSELAVVGGEESVILVEVNPTLMIARGISLDMITSTLATASLRISGGEVEGEFGAMKVVLKADAITVGEINELFVIPEVKLHEVATVYEGAIPDRSYTWYSSKTVSPTEVVILSVAKREGSSAPAVTSAVKNEIDTKLKEVDFKDLSYEIVSDDGVVATNEIRGLTMNLISSILIVGAVLFLFLSTRAALVVLITVPLTFLSVLGIGLLAGESMNRITLFALILSLGLLVDSAIVVVDNIYDHLKRAYEVGQVVNLPFSNELHYRYDGSLYESNCFFCTDGVNRFFTYCNCSNTFHCYQIIKVWRKR